LPIPDGPSISSSPPVPAAAPSTTACAAGHAPVAASPVQDLNREKFRVAPSPNRRYSPDAPDWGSSRIKEDGVRLPLASRAIQLLTAATVALGLGFCAASAYADPIGQVYKGPDSSDPNSRVPWHVQATLNGNTLTITNPGENEALVFAYDNGDQGVITSVDLNGPGGYTGNGGPGGNGAVANGSFTANKPFTVNSPSGIGSCNVLDYINAFCSFARYTGEDASGGLHPGQSATITYPTNAPGSLGSVSVNFDYDDIFPHCRPSGYGDDAVFHSDFGELGSTAAASSANDCLPPVKVRITAVHINKKKHTASFHQTAKHATGFGCILKRNNKVMFDHSCGATKAYTHRLPGGSYIYQVWAVNKSGVSRDFAVAHFKLS
jgi:hypothetical protein